MSEVEVGRGGRGYEGGEDSMLWIKQAVNSLTEKIKRPECLVVWMGGL